MPGQDRGKGKGLLELPRPEGPTWLLCPLILTCPPPVRPVPVHPHLCPKRLALGARSASPALCPSPCHSAFSLFAPCRPCITPTSVCPAQVST